jgi:peptidoglycan hydrolase-like protein with peptidoglycan-binding domain
VKGLSLRNNFNLELGIGITASQACTYTAQGSITIKKDFELHKPIAIPYLGLKDFGILPNLGLYYITKLAMDAEGTLSGTIGENVTLKAGTGIYRLSVDQTFNALPVPHSFLEIVDHSMLDEGPDIEYDFRPTVGYTGKAEAFAGLKPELGLYLVEDVCKLTFGAKFGVFAKWEHRSDALAFSPRKNDPGQELPILRGICDMSHLDELSLGGRAKSLEAELSLFSGEKPWGLDVGYFQKYRLLEDIVKPIEGLVYCDADDRCPCAHEGEACDANFCCERLNCDTATNKCVGDCATKGKSCVNQKCCTNLGLKCDANSNECVESDCANKGESCAFAPCCEGLGLTCDAANTCADCASKGESCAAKPCCSHFHCDVTKKCADGPVECPSTFAACSTKPELRIDHSVYKASVVDLQCLLNSKLGTALVTDGLFGSATHDFVSAWQEKHSLAADGIVGSRTWDSLCNASGPCAREGASCAVAGCCLYPSFLQCDAGTCVKCAAEGSSCASSTCCPRFQCSESKTCASGPVKCPSEFETCTSRPLLQHDPATYQPEVVELQCLLNSQESAGLVTDGLFGSTTATAVRAWQETHGLAVDGIVGPATWESLCDSAGTCKSFPGYVFWPGFDSAGYDINGGGVGRRLETLESMVKSCTDNSLCKGLTTSGFLKAYIKPARLWTPWYPSPGPCDGLYIKKPSRADFVLNQFLLNDTEVTRLKWIAEWTVPNFAMSRRDAIADYLAKGALWSLTEEVLLLRDNPWDYSNCSSKQINPLETCPDTDWRMGIAAVQVSKYNVAELEDRGKKAFSAHFGYPVTAEDVLARAAIQAGYVSGNETYNKIVKATGDLRKAWLLKAHLVGFYFVAKEIERDCLITSPKFYCWGRFTPSGIPTMIQQGIDGVSILLQSLIGASGSYTV